MRAGVGCSPPPLRPPNTLPALSAVTFAATTSVRCRSRRRRRPCAVVVAKSSREKVIGAFPIVVAHPIPTFSPQPPRSHRTPPPIVAIAPRLTPVLSPSPPNLSPLCDCVSPTLKKEMYSFTSLFQQQKTCRCCHWRADAQPSPSSPSSPSSSAARRIERQPPTLQRIRSDRIPVFYCAERR